MDWETLYEAQQRDYHRTVLVFNAESGEYVEVIADGDEEGPAGDPLFSGFGDD